MAAAHSVVGDARQHDRRVHERRPVHRLGRHGHLGREEGEEEAQQQVAHSEHVDGQAEAAEAPRPKRNVLAEQALADEEANGDEVRREEAGQQERDNGVEGRRRANVDERQQRDKARRERNGVERNDEARVDLGGERKKKEEKSGLFKRIYKSFDTLCCSPRGRREEEGEKGHDILERSFPKKASRGHGQRPMSVLTWTLGSQRWQK